MWRSGRAGPHTAPAARSPLPSDGPANWSQIIHQLLNIYLSKFYLQYLSTVYYLMSIIIRCSLLSPGCNYQLPTKLIVHGSDHCISLFAHSWNLESLPACAFTNLVWVREPFFLIMHVYRGGDLWSQFDSIACKKIHHAQSTYKYMCIVPPNKEIGQFLTSKEACDDTILYL